MLFEIVKAVASAAAGALAGNIANTLLGRMRRDGHEPAANEQTPQHAVPRRYRLIAVGAVLGVTIMFAANAVRSSPSSGPSRTVYSSIASRAPGGGPNKQAQDMHRAIELALRESDRKAGKFTVKYERLDSTDETGAFLPRKIQENARRAAQDDDTAVYIGELSSSASTQSIPILSRARIPQISPASTRVGLTVGDSLSDVGEPQQYYRGGSRNFVRVIPNDDVQAAALNALMRRDRCDNVAIIYDGHDYSQGLSALMRLFPRPRRSFSDDIRPSQRSQRYEKLADDAKVRGVDCFLYVGDDNPNTLGILQTFANALPNARLYGTEGVSESSLRDAEGNLANFADRVSLMVAPRDLNRDDAFNRSFALANNGALPDPYAIYAYEAMRLALDAIKESGSGEPADILEELTNTEDRDSLLGTYSIDDNGDTTLVDYDVMTFAGGKARVRRAVGRKTLTKYLELLRERK